MRKYKGYIIGSLIGASLMFSAQSFAAIGNKVEAVFANFTIKVNGQVKVLETTPLVYNGTSYLPVRDVSNLIGYDVTYKADSRTIELNNENNSEKDSSDNHIDTKQTQTNSSELDKALVSKAGYETIELLKDYISVPDEALSSFKYKNDIYITYKAAHLKYGLDATDSVLDIKENTVFYKNTSRPIYTDSFTDKNSPPDTIWYRYNSSNKNSTSLAYFREKVIIEITKK